MTAWKDERVEALKQLWVDGYSASQIAGRLGGTTRNAVVAKVHRLGLAGRATLGRSGPRRAAPRPQRTSAPLPATPLPPPAPEDVPTVSLQDATDSACRWPCANVEAVSRGIRTSVVWRGCRAWRTARRMWRGPAPSQKPAARMSPPLCGTRLMLMRGRRPPASWRRQHEHDDHVQRLLGEPPEYGRSLPPMLAGCPGRGTSRGAGQRTGEAREGR